MGRISVIIPCGYDPDGLEAALSALGAVDDEGIDHEVIVANDGADTAVTAVAERFGAREVQVVPNGGPGVARNHAMAAATGSHFAFLDADAVPKKDWLSAIAEAAPSSDFLAGEVLIDPEQVTTFAHYHDLLFAFPVQQYLKNRFSVTANLVVSRRLVDAIGGFDPRLRACEDREFGERAAGAGFDQVYAPQVVVLHPPRDLDEKLRKIRREIHSTVHMYHCYPQRFPSSKPTLRMARIFCEPPRNFAVRGSLWSRGVVDGLKLYLLQWRLNIRRGRELARYVGTRAAPSLPTDAYANASAGSARHGIGDESSR